MVQSTQNFTFWERHGLPLPGTSLTPDGYDALPEVNIRVELVNGTVFYPDWEVGSMSPTPRSRHQTVVGNVFLLLHDAIPNGEVILSPMEVRLADDVRLQPDLFWIAEDGACENRDTHFAGAPDLTVEVLSPSSVRHDKTTKFLLYEQHAVREYWLVNPDREQVEVWSLRDNEFALVGTFGMGESFTSPVLDDTTVSVAAMFE